MTHTTDFITAQAEMTSYSDEAFSLPVLAKDIYYFIKISGRDLLL
jgi:hypothetical protein